MNPYDHEYTLSHGKPHVFKMTLDDGYACYQYNVKLNENWSMYWIATKLRELLKRYNGSVSCGKFSDGGYLYNETGKSEVDTEDQTKQQRSSGKSASDCRGKQEKLERSKPSDLVKNQSKLRTSKARKKPAKKKARK